MQIFIVKLLMMPLPFRFRLHLGSLSLYDLFRCFCALAIQLLQPASCFKTNSTYRQPSVITASLYCHCPPMLQISFCRSYLQFSTEYHLLLQGFMFCLQQVACIFSIVAAIVGSEELSEASQILSCLSDMVYCS